MKYAILQRVRLHLCACVRERECFSFTLLAWFMLFGYHFRRKSETGLSTHYKIPRITASRIFKLYFLAYAERERFIKCHQMFSSLCVHSLARICFVRSFFGVFFSVVFFLLFVCLVSLFRIFYANVMQVFVSECVCFFTVFVFIKFDFDAMH